MTPDCTQTLKALVCAICEAHNVCSQSFLFVCDLRCATLPLCTDTLADAGCNEIDLPLAKVLRQRVLYGLISLEINYMIIAGALLQ
jgi:hypothetical protein